jgi:hypothetical protein
MKLDSQDLQSELLRMVRREIADAVKAAEELGIDRQTLIDYGCAPLLAKVYESKWARIIPDADSHAATAKAALLKYRALVPSIVPDEALPGLALCLFANHEDTKDDEELPGRLANAAYGRGLFEGVVIGIGNEDFARRVRSNLARVAARASVANSPKQAAKAEAFKLWRDWATGKAKYKSGAAFARDVCARFPVIENQKTAERWATQWRKEAAAKRRKQAAS